jgi:hypothetical protein
MQKSNHVSRGRNRATLPSSQQPILQNLGERRGVRIARMRVTPMSVCLPNLYLGVANGFALQIEHAPHDVQDLTLGATRSTGHFR